MLKYAVKQWDANKGRLEEAIRKYPDIKTIDYLELVKMVVRYILNDEHEFHERPFWEWSEEVDEIDNGDYQGTLIFLIHRETYQPSAEEYLMTSVCYGSCSVCDTLEGIILCISQDRGITDGVVEELMTLCKDIVTGLVHPFNARHADFFEEAEV